MFDEKLYRKLPGRINDICMNGRSAATNGTFIAAVHCPEIGYCIQKTGKRTKKNPAAGYSHSRAKVC